MNIEKTYSLIPKKGLDLPSSRQFLTLYPHLSENEWTGFILYQHEYGINDTIEMVPDEPVIAPKKADDSDETDPIEWPADRPKALIQATNATQLIGYDDLLKNLADTFQLHFTISDESFKSLFGENSVNHGFIPHWDYQELLTQMDVVVGVGFPFDDMTGMEAISRGAYYISQKYSKARFLII